LTKKLAAFAQSAASFYNNLPNPNTGFWEKRQFFSPKIGKNRRKFDDNIDTWSDILSSDFWPEFVRRRKKFLDQQKMAQLSTLVWGQLPEDYKLVGRLQFTK
jgi:hypothetical protein